MPQQVLGDLEDKELRPIALFDQLKGKLGK